MSPTEYRRPRVNEELAQRIDQARGDVPFDRWVRRALEAHLILQGMPSPFEDGPATAAAREAFTTENVSRQLQSLTVPTCPECGKSNGVHKGTCSHHPRNR